jgi:two-component system sensor histidine kinase/response regulator
MEAIAALRAAALAERPFEVVILDRQMPGFGGLMVAQAIKRDPTIRDAKLVMMTSLGDLNDGADLERAGILLCVTKPVKQALIRECLERAITHSTAQAAPAQVDVASAPWAPNRAHVLVAGDNIVNQKVALLQLRRLGFATDYVSKPIQPAELQATLNRCLALDRPSDVSLAS